MSKTSYILKVLEMEIFAEKGCFISKKYEMQKKLFANLIKKK